MSVSTTNSLNLLYKALAKLSSRKWASPIGISLLQTSAILEQLEEFEPIYLVLGGSVGLGSVVLNSDCDLQDLREERKVLDHAKGHFAGVVEKALAWRLKDIEERLGDPEKEVIENFDIIRQNLQSDFEVFSIDMTLLEHDIHKSLALDPKIIKSINLPDFKHVIKCIEYSYNSFQNGAYDLNYHFSTKPYYIFHLQNLIEKFLNPIQVQDHLDLVHKQYGSETCKKMLAYVILLLSKDLQLTAAFFLCNNDLKRTVFMFQRFNDYYRKYVRIYEKLMGEPFVVPSTKKPTESIDHQWHKNQLPDVAIAEHQNGYENVDKQTRRSLLDLKTQSILEAQKLLETVELSTSISLIEKARKIYDEIIYLKAPKVREKIDENYQVADQVLRSSLIHYNKGNFGPRLTLYLSFYINFEEM